MKLILALGNPGAEYVNSRHNIGWQVLDRFAKSRGVDFQPSTKFKAEVANLTINNDKLVLAKPTTFYNLVGESAKIIAEYYKISPEDILVIHDDLSINFGTIRTRLGGSDAGNNGIKSLSQHLDPNFWRLRIGTNNSSRKQINDATFVLQTFSEIERSHLVNQILPIANYRVEDFLSNCLEPTSQTVPLPTESNEDTPSLLK